MRQRGSRCGATGAAQQRQCSVTAAVQHDSSGEREMLQRSGAGPLHCCCRAASLRVQLRVVCMHMVRSAAAAALPLCHTLLAQWPATRRRVGGRVCDDLQPRQAGTGGGSVPLAAAFLHSRIRLEIVRTTGEVRGGRRSVAKSATAQPPPGGRPHGGIQAPFGSLGIHRVH
jgi:hypothetical protein